MKNQLSLLLIFAMFMTVPFGPAPSSHDGVSDGSGLPTHGAPNSGDGIPDGSGF